MKLVMGLLITIAGLSISNAASASISDVATVYCREIPMAGVFGRPASANAAMGKHCVSFQKGFMTDNANTFFGNPPETVPYKLQGRSVIIERNGKLEEAYKFESRERLVNSAGAVLLLQK